MTDGYILNTVQTARPLLTVFESIKDGQTTSEELQADTNLSDDLLSQGLNGLLQLGMIGREESEYYTVDFAWNTGDRERDFKMTVLRNLATAAEPDNWDKQSVVLLNYQYFLQEDIQYFHAGNRVLFENIDEWEHQEQGYRPQSQQGRIKLNEPKFVNWTRLADFLGLIQQATGREFVIYPDHEMILHSIRIATGEGSRMPIQEYVEWLRDNLILVELTSELEVPAPLARVLYHLIRSEKIRLVEHGDAGAVGLDRVPRRTGMDRYANSIEV